jgi:hypothetical protein
MKSLLALSVSLLSISGLSSLAHADQAATLTCVSDEIILSVRSPYLGEDSDAAQKLYILKSVDSDDSESTYTAYFLDVSKTVATDGSVSIDGKNKEGGSFSLRTSRPVDSSDDTAIRWVSEGFITYHHGPLAGTNAAVTCVEE